MRANAIPLGGGFKTLDISAVIPTIRLGYG